MNTKISRASLAIMLLTAAASASTSALAQGAPASPPAIVQNAPQATLKPLSPAMRRQVFNIVWGKVNNFYYDPKFGGLNWNAVKVKYVPKVNAAKSDAQFYAVLGEMLKELNQSHFGIIPPEAYAAEAPVATAAGTGANQDPGTETAPSASGEAAAQPANQLEGDDSEAVAGTPGTAGVTVQLVEGQPAITRVVSGSGGETAGLKPGFVITSIGGRPIGGFLEAFKKRGRTEREYATFVRLGMESILSGPSGRRIPIGYRDASDKMQTAIVKLGPVAGVPIKFGQLPSLYVQTEKSRLDGNIGYIRFNIFLMPIAKDVLKAITELHDTKGMIIDVRGNPGGMGPLAGTVARSFYTKAVNLGTMTLRNGNQNFPINPTSDPYTAPVVILTDEGSASTSEILAAGMKETGRAVTVGTTTAGEALPSLIEILPGGARLQYAIADLKTPSGKMLEGEGVTPTIPVTLTRRDLLAGRDPILDAAVAYLKDKAASGTPASK